MTTPHTQTITDQNKHILEEEFKKLTDQEFNEFIHDDDTKDGNPVTVLGTVFKNIDDKSKKIFMEVAVEENAKRGYWSLDQNDNDNTNDTTAETEIEIDLDTDTALLQAIKSSNLKNMSIFKKSRILEQIEDSTNINRNRIEGYLEQNNTINETVAHDDAFFTQIQESLRIINPVNKPEISVTMTESQIWSVIRENEDWLLESKLKTHHKAKSNEYKAKTKAHKAVSKVTHKDCIHEMNKLQVQILEDIEHYHYPEIDQVSEALDEGIKRYKSLKEVLDVTVPQDDSLLSRYIRFTEHKEKPQVKEIYEQAEAYLKQQMTGSKKDLKPLSFFNYKSVIEFNGTDPKLKFLGKYKIILKESKESFYFNICTEAFTQTPKRPVLDIRNQINEDYITDLLKAKKTLERQYKGKKFQATSDTSDTDSIKHIDTNGWRIHLYNDLKDKSIDYNIEYYPTDYQKTDLTETQKFHDTIEEALTEKRFAKYLANGEHFVLDTGEVLWYSSADKEYMIDMEPKPFHKLFDLYLSTDNKPSNILRTAEK